MDRPPEEVRSANNLDALIWFLSIFGIVGLGLLIAFINKGDGIFLFVGLLFSLTWLVVIPLGRRKWIQSHVRKNGRRLLTQYVEVIDASEKQRRVKGEASPGPFFVKTSWYDLENNTLYYFQSNLLSKNPHLHLVHIEGIYVYVDPKDFYKNHMDLSFLPQRFFG